MLNLVMPPQSELGYLTPILVLLGFLALLGLMGFIVFVVYLSLRSKKPVKVEKKKGEEIKPDRLISDVKLFVVYTLQFFSCWVALGSIVWMLEVLLFTLISKSSYSYWYYIIPYFLIILTFPISSIICLKTWSAIKRSQGEEKQILAQRKKIFLMVQLFFSAVFFVLFTGLTFVLLIIAFVESIAYWDNEIIMVLIFPIIPAIMSFLTGLWYWVEFMYLRKEVER